MSNLGGFPLSVLLEVDILFRERLESRHGIKENNRMEEIARSFTIAIASTILTKQF